MFPLSLQEVMEGSLTIQLQNTQKWIAIDDDAWVYKNTSSHSFAVVVNVWTFKQVPGLRTAGKERKNLRLSLIIIQQINTKMNVMWQCEHNPRSTHQWSNSKYI